MKQLIIFLKGFLSILIGMAGAITCISAVESHNPLFTVCGIITLMIWVYGFILYMKEKIREGKVMSCNCRKNKSQVVKPAEFNPKNVSGGTKTNGREEKK